MTATEIKPWFKNPQGPAKPELKDDLKTLPMPEVEKRLESSPGGLSQAEAAKKAGTRMARTNSRRRKTIRSSNS